MLETIVNGNLPGIGLSGLVNVLKLKDILLIHQDVTGSFGPLALGGLTSTYFYQETGMAEQQGTLEQVVAILQIVSGLNFDAFALHELSCAIESMAEEKKHAESEAS